MFLPTLTISWTHQGFGILPKDTSTCRLEGAGAQTSSFLCSLQYLCACCSHRCRVVLVPSGADHPTENLQPISADVSCCVDGLLRHHLAVNKHFGARLTDGEVKLQRRKRYSHSFKVSFRGPNMNAKQALR